MNNFVKQLNDIDLASTSSIPEEKVEVEKNETCVDDGEASSIWNKSLLDYAEDQFQCCICTEMIIDAVTLNCSHTFCSYCILQWKDKKSICPICRVKIRVELPTKIVDSFIDKLVENSSDELKQRRKELREEREKNEALYKKNKQCVCDSCDQYDLDDDDDDESSDSIFNYVLPYFTTNPYDSDFYHESDEYDDDLIFFDNAEVEANVVVTPAPPQATTVNNAYYGGYGRCFNCGDFGHWRNGCPSRRNYRDFGSCFSCGQVGHWANECPNR